MAIIKGLDELFYDMEIDDEVDHIQLILDDHLTEKLGEFESLSESVKLYFSSSQIKSQIKNIEIDYFFKFQTRHDSGNLIAVTFLKIF